MADFRAKITADADLKNATSAIDSFVNQTRKLTVDVDLKLTNAGQNLANILSQLQGQAGSAGASAGAQFASGFNGSLGQIKVTDASKQLSDFKTALSKNFKFDTKAVDNISKSIENMGVSVNSVKSKMLDNGKFSVSVTGVDQLGRAVTVAKNFNSAGKEVSSTLTTIAQAEKQVSSEQLNIANNKLATWANNNASATKAFSTEVQNLQTQMQAMQANGASQSAYQQWTQQFTELQTRAKAQERASDAQMKIAENNFTAWANKNTTGLKAYTQEADNLRTQMQNMQMNGATRSELKDWQERAKVLQSNVKAQDLVADTQLEISGNKFDAWLNNNSKASKAFGVEIADLQKRMEDMQASGNATGAELKQWEQDVQAVQTRAAATGNTGKTFLDSFSGAFGSMVKFAASYVTIRKIFSEMANGLKTVIALDDALVDLQKTTTATPQQLNAFYNEANGIAKQYGTTTQQIIQGAADWSRLGYSLEDSKQMAKLSSQFASISPGMNVEESTNSLVSTMKAFGIEADQTLDGIMSKVNVVGNNFALSNADVMTALKNSSAAMAAANSTFEETVALITAGQEIAQDSSKVGNALRTISMRIRGMNEETEEFDGTLQTIGGDVYDLTNGKVSIMLDPETYKSPYKILQDISKVWNELTDVQQAELCLYVQKCA